MNHPMHDHDSDLLEETITHEQVTEPPMYNVWLLNDHYTPMEYVVEMLREVFNKPRGIAMQIMIQVHNSGEKGRGLIAKYPQEIAEDKQRRVAAFAQERNIPLMVQVERETSGTN